MVQVKSVHKSSYFSALHVQEREWHQGLDQSSLLWISCDYRPDGHLSLSHKDGIHSYWTLSVCVSVNSMINTAKRQAWALRVYRLYTDCQSNTIKTEEMRKEREDIPSVPAQGRSACPEGQWLWGKVCHACASLDRCDSLSSLQSHTCLSMLSHLLTKWVGVIGVCVRARSHAFWLV